MPMFSVIVPAYNQAGTVAAALDSVLAQSFADYELIVANDGSTDETGAVLEAYRDRALIVRQENGGLASARNFGMAHASGRYLVFLDSDDLLPPWALATYAEIIERESPSIVMTRVFKFSNADELESLKPATVVSHSYPDYLSAAREGHPVTVAVAACRDLVLEAGGFNEQLRAAEDQDLFLRLGTAGGFVFVDAPHLYAYRQHDGTLSRNLATLHRSLRFVLREEARGRYAGGRARRSERRFLQARMLRYTISRCLGAGEVAKGYDLYLRGLPRLLGAGRWHKLLRLALVPIRRPTQPNSPI